MLRRLATTISLGLDSAVDIIHDLITKELELQLQTF